MKKILYLIMCLGVFGFISCEEDYDTPPGREDFTNVISEITSSSDTTTLLKKNENQVWKTITWSKAKFVGDLNPMYYVQIAKAGAEFSQDFEFKAEYDTAISIKQSEINTFLIEKFKAGVIDTIDLDIRIRAYVHQDIEMTYSEKQSGYRLVTYLDIPEPEKLYTVMSGDYTNSLQAYKDGSVFTKYMELKKDSIYMFTDKQAADGYKYGFDKFAKKSDNLVDVKDDNHSFKFTGNDGWYQIVADFTNSEFKVQEYSRDGLSYSDFDYDSIFVVGSINGWDEKNALPMKKEAPGIYSIELTLPKDAAFKFIDERTWKGRDFSSIKEGNEGIVGPKGQNGNIKYDGGGSPYVVTLDLIKGIYTIKDALPEKMYMIGGAIGGWDWSKNAIELAPVHSNPHLFWTIRYFNKDGFKVNSSKAWNGKEFGTPKDFVPVKGVYDKGGDNVNVQTAGVYVVVVNLLSNTIEVAEPKIYGMGAAFGNDWDAAKDSKLFTVDHANKVVKFENAASTGGLRAHVAASTLTNKDGNAVDWWQAEFNYEGGKIGYRGTGGDPVNFAVTAGQTIKFDFANGTVVAE